MGKKSHRKRIPRGSELLWDSISGCDRESTRRRGEESDDRELIWSARCGKWRLSGHGNYPPGGRTERTFLL